MEEEKSKKEELLLEYFQDQMLDYEVSHKLDIDRQLWRFYFTKNKKNHYILDVDRNLLDDEDLAKAISGLKAAKWKDILEANRGSRVPCYMGHGSFEFSKWPDQSKKIR